ncbi:hypothetical protein chiPu_0003377 [Chiloscyllium punctatum]|uniref:SHSP domain-containing protein n=1 Tax=Chiloscyllium punctatum TaxID=137246 RepID=A0A401S3K4_CHIPU|nr:hypothetical protein [Chiloscyllium punctatum]
MESFNCCQKRKRNRKTRWDLQYAGVSSSLDAHVQQVSPGAQGCAGNGMCSRLKAAASKSATDALCSIKPGPQTSSPAEKPSCRKRKRTCKATAKPGYVVTTPLYEAELAATKATYKKPSSRLAPPTSSAPEAVTSKSQHISRPIAAKSQTRVNARARACGVKRDCWKSPADHVEGETGFMFQVGDPLAAALNPLVYCTSVSSHSESATCSVKSTAPRRKRSRKPAPESPPALGLRAFGSTDQAKRRKLSAEPTRQSPCDRSRPPAGTPFKKVGRRKSKRTKKTPVKKFSRPPNRAPKPSSFPPDPTAQLCCLFPDSGSRFRCFLPDTSVQLCYLLQDPAPKPCCHTPDPAPKPCCHTPDPAPKPCCHTPDPAPKPCCHTPDPAPKPCCHTPDPTPKPCCHTPDPTPKPCCHTPDPTPKPWVQSLEGKESHEDLIYSKRAGKKMGDNESNIFASRDFGSRTQSRRSQNQLDDSDLAKFSMCLNLGDIPPQNVKMSVTDRVVTVSGYEKEIAEDDDGMVRETFHGFSNEFGLPEGVDANTLTINDNQDQSVTIEADYYIPRGTFPGAESSPSICQGAPSPGIAQRENDFSVHDTSKSMSFLPSLTSSTITGSQMGTLNRSSINDASSVCPLHMEGGPNVPETLANVTSQIPSQFDISSLCSASPMRNMPGSMVYSENISFQMTPENGLKEMMSFQNTMCCAPDNSTMFSQLSPGAQLSPCQLKALQQSNVSSVEDNLEDVLLESVKAFVKDRFITISGNRAEITEEENGMIRCNYRGFSKKFCLPQGTDPSTLKLTTPDGNTLVVELAYCGLPVPKLDASMLKNLFDASRSHSTGTPFPNSLDRMQAQVGSALSMSNQAPACVSNMQMIPRRSSVLVAPSTPTAAVKPIRQVSFCHGDPSVSLYEEPRNSLSAVYNRRRSFIRMAPDQMQQRRHCELLQSVPSKYSAAIHHPYPNASSQLQATMNASHWRSVGQSKV